MKVFKKILSIFLRIGISLALLIFLFYFKKIDARSLLADIKSADKPLLLLAFFISLFSYILGFFRWEMLLKAAEIYLPIKRVIISFSSGIFFNLFLPSTIGGDFARTIDLSKHTKRTKEVVATVFLDRLSGYVGLAITLLFSLILGWKLIKNDVTVLMPAALIILILIILLLVLFNKFLYSQINKLLEIPNAGKFRESIKNLLEEIHYFKGHKKVLFNNLVLSLFIQAIGPLVFYTAALSLGVTKINLLYFFIFIPIIGAITLLPISIGGFGVRESTSVLLFATAGITESLAVAMALLNSIFILIYGAIGGIIYVLTIHHRRIQHHQPSSL